MSWPHSAKHPGIWKTNETRSKPAGPESQSYRRYAKQARRGPRRIVVIQAKESSCKKAAYVAGPDQNART